MDLSLGLMGVDKHMEKWSQPVYVACLWGALVSERWKRWEKSPLPDLSHLYGYEVLK